MKTLSLYQEFDISLYEADTWEYGTHKHSFFELVYILDGNGTHILNDNKYPYAKNSLYFLTPNDTHAFEIQSRTKFCILTFNKVYFSREKNEKSNLMDFGELFKKIEFILYNSNHLQQDIINNVDESKFVEIVINRLVVEMTIKDIFYESMIQNSVILLLSLIARNVQVKLEGYLKQTHPNSDIADILLYIQRHIYDNEKIRIENLASEFCKSKNYFGAYFKSATGESVKDYILNYKLSLAKNRLLYSGLTVSQIAYELGFTDESHLNKLFKDRLALTAKEYRKQNKLE